MRYLETFYTSGVAIAAVALLALFLPTAVEAGCGISLGAVQFHPTFFYSCVHRYGPSATSEDAAVGLTPLRDFAWVMLTGTVAGRLSSMFVVGSFAVRALERPAAAEGGRHLAAGSKVPRRPGPLKFF